MVEFDEVIMISSDDESDAGDYDINQSNSTPTFKALPWPESETGHLAGMGEHADSVKEVCKHYPPIRVDFYQEDGSKIANYVSQGPTGEPTDLFMTYVFEWRHPAVEEGSEQAGKLEAGHKTTAKMAVESSIETIRRLVSEGKI